MRRVIWLTLLLVLAANVVYAGAVDPLLQGRADAYQGGIENWWFTGDMGGLTTVSSWTDDTYTTLVCLQNQGDSMIWTGMYLGSQALRYLITGDADALSETQRIVTYMHNAMLVTQTLGYIPRYFGHDVWPWNCNNPDGSDWKVKGTGDWDGYYWVHQTSRDQYSGYWWGMTLAYEALAGQDEEKRGWIRQDFADIIQMLVTNSWNITDENGQYTGNHAAWVGGVMRLAWLVQAAHVIDEQYYWDLLDDQFDKNKIILPIDTNSFFNRYDEFFGNNLRHLAFQSMFRLWPDRERLQFLYDTWQKQNRPWTKNIHNPFFDAVHITGCRRLGECDGDELASIQADALNTLGRYWDPPDYIRGVTCSDQPLDPFSVWMNDFLDKYPALRQLIDVHPQTEDGRELDDRPWTDMYWQSGDVFIASCATGDDKAQIGAGFDYLVAYWMGVYYATLPGDGPYGDDDPTDDDTMVDDDTIDDDTIDDDTVDDDAVDDDAVDDDAVDDDAVDDDAVDDDAVDDDAVDDDAIDDDQADDDSVDDDLTDDDSGHHDSGDDDNSGCGC